MILVSACLVGINCKYNGGNNYNEEIFQMVKRGEDVTEQFEKGAREVVELAKKLGIKKAILQARSPSCGVGKIYSGNFDGKLIDGNGILAEMLMENGIEVEKR